MALSTRSHKKSAQKQNFSSFDYVPLRLSYTTLKQPVSTISHSFSRRRTTNHALTSPVTVTCFLSARRRERFGDIAK